MCKKNILNSQKVQLDVEWRLSFDTMHIPGIPSIFKKQFQVIDSQSLIGKAVISISITEEKHVQF